MLNGRFEVSNDETDVRLEKLPPLGGGGRETAIHCRTAHRLHRVGGTWPLWAMSPT